MTTRRTGTEFHQAVGQIDIERLGAIRFPIDFQFVAVPCGHEEPVVRTRRPGGSNFAYALTDIAAVFDRRTILPAIRAGSGLDIEILAVIFREESEREVQTVAAPRMLVEIFVKQIIGIVAEFGFQLIGRFARIACNLHRIGRRRLQTCEGETHSILRILQEVRRRCAEWEFEILSNRIRSFIEDDIVDISILLLFVLPTRIPCYDRLGIRRLLVKRNDRRGKLRGQRREVLRRCRRVHLRIRSEQRRDTDRIGGLRR